MVRPLHRIAALATLAGSLLAPAGATHAESIDLTRATCAEFSAMTSNDQSQLVLWLAGYYAGGAQRPLLDVEKVTAAPAELLSLCGKTPQLPLLGAETRAVFLPAPTP